MTSRALGDRPPPVPDWPELAALRALPPGDALLAPGITQVDFARELAARGAPVPAELLELLAATDGLVLRNCETGEVVFRLETAQGLAVAERDGRPVLAIGSWWIRPFGHSRESIQLWLDGDLLTGAFERAHPGEAPQQARFGARPLDVREVLRFALAKVEARAGTEHERELGIVGALEGELSWEWYLADDGERSRMLADAPAAAAKKDG
jgi:hypothetical protein